ncbi:acetyl-coenzyme-A carboxylase [Blastocladiella emersonii ATCC 22665]|nr:acetyl-coenzyme-A carboxylase [Blastocladiella emersonii ATCC 22665]
MALKELRVRGDFRTTVEYLITQLETDEFAKDHFSTEWLDARIQQKLTAEGTDRWVSIVTDAATMAYLAAEDQKVQFLKSLNKGQVPTLAGIKNQFSTSFNIDGVPFDIAVTLAAHDLFSCPTGAFSSCARSRVTYASVDVACTRLSMNGHTVALEQDPDPTQLRAPSPGKLMRWHIPNAGHVGAGKAFARRALLCFDGMLHGRTERGFPQGAVESPLQ